jgi:hypothetical protein
VVGYRRPQLSGHPLAGVGDLVSDVNRALRHYCDEVLYYHWDPIGVSEAPAARDEYDSYVSGVVSLVTRGATEEEIVAFLTNIETSHMGLTSNLERARLAAGILLSWREELADPRNGRRLTSRCT